MNRPKPTWRSEFSDEFAVPSEIEALVAAGELADLSWHNDTCPSFGWSSDRDSEQDLRIWVDHPEEGKRERFNDRVDRFMTLWTVSCSIQAEFRTDNVQTAIARYREWLPLVQATASAHAAAWKPYRVRVLLRSKDPDSEDADKRLAEAHREVDRYLRDSDARVIVSGVTDKVATILFETDVDVPERLHVELSSVAGDMELLSRWLLLDRPWDRTIGEQSRPWPEMSPTNENG
jgi:hypothetical protein